MSLSLKVIGIICFSLLLLVLMNTLLFSSFLTNLVEQNNREREQEIARLFAKINAIPLEHYNYYAVQTNVNDLKTNQGIMSISVFDAGGMLINVDSGANPDVDSLRKIGNRYKEDIVGSDGKTIGSIDIVFDQSRLQKKIYGYRLFMFLLSLVAVSLILLVLFYLFSRTVLTPVRALYRSVSEVSRGNLDHRASIASDDELGQLAVQFNEMTGKLRESIAMKHSIIAAMPSLLIAVNSKHRVIEWNSEAEHVTGLTEGEATGRELETLPFIGSLLSPYKDKVAAAIAQGAHQTFGSVEQADKEGAYYDVFIYPLTKSFQGGAVIRIDDATERERKETELRQAQKMDTIGTLAGGLAHDFNNVLGGIAGSASLIHYRFENLPYPVDAEIASYLQIIDEETKRATDIVQQLLTMSRKQTIAFAACDLTVSVKRVLKICDKTFEKAVDIRYTTENDSACMVFADASMIEQVLLNLCVNSYHSMTIMRPPGAKQGGILSLHLARIIADPLFCENHREADNRTYWKLSVEDTGIGIEQKNLAKVFDPFFTTKSKGKGTGLGLTMAYNIIRQHHGFIDVYSEIGTGSCFTVYLPELADSVVPAAEIGTHDIQRGKGEKILVVDDEQPILQIARGILENTGYKVIIASDGESAVKVFREQHETISLVLLDMMMPHKTGQETFHELRAIDPDVTVIISSGFRKDERVEQVMKEGARAFIQKPYSLYALAELVRQILG